MTDTAPLCWISMNQSDLLLCFILMTHDAVISKYSTKKTLNHISVSFQYGWRCIQMSYWDILKQSRWAVILFTDCAEESVPLSKQAASIFIPSYCFVWLQMFKLRFGQFCHFEEGGFVFELLFLRAAGRGHQRCKCSFK